MSRLIFRLLFPPTQPITYDFFFQITEDFKINLIFAQVPPDRPRAVEEVLGFPHPAVILRPGSSEGNFYTAGGPALALPT